MTFIEALATKLSAVLMQLVLLIGQWRTNIACGGTFYQPEVPKEMKRA